MSVELPNFPNIPGSPRWVEVARDRDRILQARIAELEAELSAMRDAAEWSAIEAMGKGAAS